MTCSRVPRFQVRQLLALLLGAALEPAIHGLDHREHGGERGAEEMRRAPGLELALGQAGHLRQLGPLGVVEAAAPAVARGRRLGRGRRGGGARVEIGLEHGGRGAILRGEDGRGQIVDAEADMHRPEEVARPGRARRGDLEQERLRDRRQEATAAACEEHERGDEGGDREGGRREHDQHAPAVSALREAELVGGVAHVSARWSSPRHRAPTGRPSRRAARLPVP
jgi:hypothetical protein